MKSMILDLYEKTLTKIENEINTNEDEAAVSVANVALSTPPLGKSTRRKKKMPEKTKKVITENDQYSHYTEGDFNIFEIKNQSDAQAYQLGLKKNSPAYWRGNETTKAMLNAMNTAKNRNFVVRTPMGDSTPMRHTGM